MNTESGQQPATTMPPLYDADAVQRMSFQTERRSVMYTVVHVFGPILDDAVLEYERRRDQRIGKPDKDQVDDPNAVSISDSSYAAAVHYWDTQGTSAEGYAGRVADADKAFAVQSMLFAVEFEPLPEAEEGKLCPEDDEDGATYRLRCLFNGASIVTEHTLRPATKDEMGRFQQLMRSTLVVRGTRFGKSDQRIPSRARSLAALYDELKQSTSGYQGRVPLHHKMAVALKHFNTEKELLSGN